MHNDHSRLLLGGGCFFSVTLIAQAEAGAVVVPVGVAVGVAAVLDLRQDGRIGGRKLFYALCNGNRMDRFLPGDDFERPWLTG